MGDIVAFRRRERHPHGSCPQCGNCSGMLNVGKAHWFFCKRHKTKWLVGYALFAGFIQETDSIWLSNAALLAPYTEVAPLPWRYAGVDS